MKARLPVLTRAPSHKVIEYVNMYVWMEGQHGWVSEWVDGRKSTRTRRLGKPLTQAGTIRSGWTPRLARPGFPRMDAWGEPCMPADRPLPVRALPASAGGAGLQRMQAGGQDQNSASQGLEGRWPWRIGVYSEGTWVRLIDSLCGTGWKFLCKRQQASFVYRCLRHALYTSARVL